MNLYELPAQDVGRVQEILATGPIHQRLMDMGFLPATEVRVERMAPSGDPVWVHVRGSQVALRRREAEAVVLAPAEEVAR